MPISDDHKLLFVHIPKNAGTSLEKSLSTRHTGHHSWMHYRDNYASEWRDYISFAVLRDPIKRFISCYNYARMEKSFWHTSIPGDKAIYGMHPDYEVCKSKTINEVASMLYKDINALRHPGWSPQFSWIENQKRIAVDCLFNIDKLHCAMNELAPTAKIEHINTSTSTCGETLGSRSLSMLSELYNADINLIESCQGCDNGIFWSKAGQVKRISRISRMPDRY